ncbi:hypothetical protein HDZ31DRAFT_43636 [Schizophyllum fasciatum]
MGRRKIEIQPIRHERNRSVTFLKRKNGLFKKAYELGVLCSVDIAVIVFEERQGHHVKLYQYGSRDVGEIVQRQLSFEGDKDTRGPNDFASGNPSMAANDDEDEEEEDGPDTGNPRKRQRTTGPAAATVPSSVKSSGTHTPSNDVVSHRTPGIDAPPLDNPASAGIMPGGPPSTADYHQYRPQGSSHKLSASIYPPPQMSNMASTLSSLPVSSDRHLPAPGLMSLSNTAGSHTARPPGAFDNSGSAAHRSMDPPPTTRPRPGPADADANPGFMPRPGSGASTSSGGADFGAGYGRTYNSVLGYTGLPPGMSSAGARFPYGGPGDGPARRTPPSSSGGMGGPPNMGDSGGDPRSIEWPLHGAGTGTTVGGGAVRGAPSGRSGGAGPPQNSGMNWLAYLGSGMHTKQDENSRS